MNEEDILKYMIGRLRQGSSANYGYDVYLPNMMQEYAAQNTVGQRLVDQDAQVERLATDASPHFLGAAWELCRRGIMRPGVSTFRAQSTQEGNAGFGYSMTPFGRKWLAESQSEDFVPTEPERFGRLMERFRTGLGPAFHARAQQAIRCYGAHCYLACCAMCGAAAESVLLRLAFEKKGDPEAVLREYRAANGRTKVQNIVVGNARQNLRDDLRVFTENLKYWRDESAHGDVSEISDEQAYIALAMLLRLAHFASDNWQELTAPAASRAGHPSR